MTSRELTRNIGISAQNIRNWRASAPSDWRYKLLMFLEDEQLTPDMVEKALTSKPEVAQEAQTIPSIVEEIKVLQEQVQALRSSQDKK